MPSPCICGSELPNDPIEGKLTWTDLDGQTISYEYQCRACLFSRYYELFAAGADVEIEDYGYERFIANGFEL